MADYFDSGYSVRVPSWHGKADVKDHYPKDWAEAREWAGLEWEPISAPTFGFEGLDKDGNVTYDPAQAKTGSYVADSERQRVVRNDTGATLGIPTNSYTIINHAEMGEVVEALLEQPNVKYETAGAIHGGSKVWALARLDEPVHLPGDNSEVYPFAALLNYHDGMGGLKALSTSERIICSNTWSAAEALGERSNTIFTFRHGAGWRDRVEEARQTIRGLKADFERYVEVGTELLQVYVTPEQRELFVVEFIPVPPDMLVSDRVMRNVENARQTVRDILAGPTSEGISGTAYGLVQAAGEYLDHYRKYRSQDSYYTRQLLQMEPLKKKAVQLAREVAAA